MSVYEAPLLFASQVGTVDGRTGVGVVSARLEPSMSTVTESVSVSSNEKGFPNARGSEVSPSSGSVSYSSAKGLRFEATVLRKVVDGMPAFAQNASDVK